VTLSLPETPDQYFIEEFLLDDMSWHPSDVYGLDPNATPSESAWFAYGTKLDTVGASYPSLVISYSNETAGGESTYQYMTPDGPGQNRNGSLVATARVQEQDGDYSTPDGSTVDASTLADAIISEVENVCARNAAGGSSLWTSLGSQSGPDAPDDTEEKPYVRIQSCTISYSWRRSP